MKPKLYLETSVVSYLTARPSHDLIRAAHQQVTRDWWETRSSFELYVSQFVLDEARAGDAHAAGRRLAALREAALLELTSAWTICSLGTAPTSPMPPCVVKLKPSVGRPVSSHRSSAHRSNW